MKFNFLRNSALALLLVVCMPLSAYAQVTQDSVAIVKADLGCGAMNKAFSGTAQYIPNTYHAIRVTLDGTQIYLDKNSPNPWTTSTVSVTEGIAHTLIAEIWDLDAPNGNMYELDGSDTWEFTIPACQGSAATGGDEKDCCPGVDPVEAVSIPLVLGATTKNATSKPTAQVAASTFIAPATGVSPLPLIVVSIVYSGVVIAIQKRGISRL